MLQSFSDYHLLQSAMWHDVLQSEGKSKKAIVYAWMKENKPLFLARITIYTALKKFTIAVAPFGPLVNFDTTPSTDELKQFLQSLTAALTEYHPIALHLNPFCTNATINGKLKALFDQCKALQPGAPLAYQPGDGTITFDTSTPPEEGLMPGFREDTRYNLKRVERENKIEITTSDKASDLELFWQLYKKAQERIGFKQERTSLYEIALRHGHALLFLANEKATGKLVSGVLAVLFQEQQSVITLISASSPEANKLRAPTLLRWRIFEWANQNGYSKVDFFAIRKEGKDQKSGYTFFKTGFGGQQIWYNTPYVFPINKTLLAIYNTYAKLLHKKN